MKYITLCLSFCALIAHGQNAAPPATPGQFPPDRVVANIGGKPVTAAEFSKLVAAMPKDVRDAVTKDPKQVIASYNMMRSFAQQAEKDKLDQDPQVRDQISLVREQVLAGVLVNRYGASIAVSDEDARKRYEADKASKYQQARIRGILIRYGGPGVIQSALDLSDPTNPKPATPPPLATENEAHAKAVQLIEKARAGADFAALAKEASDDKQSAAGGGLFPIVHQTDKIPDVIRAVVFGKLKPGEISEPLQQAMAFYVVKLEELGITPFEEAKPVVAAAIKQERFARWMEEARKPFEVTIEDPSFFGLPPQGAVPVPGPPPTAPAAAPSASPAK